MSGIILALVAATKSRTSTPTIDYMLIGGGGPGGGYYVGYNSNGGGGGAGRMVEVSGQSVADGVVIPIAVGAGGGISEFNGNASGTAGGNGGVWYDASHFNTPGAGGGCGNMQAPGYGPNAHYGGGSSYASTCGGGAGADADGYSAAGAGSGGNGGDGKVSSISGTATYYGGGGGGGSNSSAASPGQGTYGCGGTGAWGAQYTANNTLGNSGVVIIRYPNTYPDAVAVTGSPTFTNTGGYKIYKFTSSGSIKF